MGKLINIDNGGTLTDFCVIDGDKVYRTKSVTTPYDLSKCFFDGLRKASRLIYGEEDLQRLLASTDHIRYSTTQGTNALVERKGPRLGLVLGGALTAKALQADTAQKSLYDALVGARCETLDAKLEGDAAEAAAVRAVTQLASRGANRIVVAFGGAQRNAQEAALKRVLLRKFPPHMLGALPILYSHEVVEDNDDARRAWTALFNAFLHPAMERFLYSAEHQLRGHKAQSPLLIFRNDGHSARIARTIAIKTYSSGPRGGAEGAKALAAHYGFPHLLSMDIGGTTTDIALVAGNQVQLDRRGRVQGVATSFPLCNVESHGVGGSSIIKVEQGKIKVGPESVGGAPGPACFGLGGKEATITDAFLLLGLLDPASYFGGELKIDLERARNAILENVGRPLKLSDEAAAQAMEKAWVEKVAATLTQFAKVTPDTTLAAFGGAGPFVVCRVAEAAGIRHVIIPSLAAVFSAFGIGFSDIAHHYEAPLASNDDAALKQAKAALLERAQRGMFAEGFELKDCRLDFTVQAGETSHALPGDSLPKGLSGALSLTLQATKPIAHTQLSGKFGGRRLEAKAAGKRSTFFNGKRADAPLYRAEEQVAGATAQGPAVLEESFYTCRVDPGWSFEINAAGDILLSRA
ncbi:MAG TPA: hydantoinase/oxoprolinase family protein [Nevskiaceae bacterium]|nr:hydantoinase/oxoprolinase family protein [Nevskiaceae bacterium]